MSHFSLLLLLSILLGIVRLNTANSRIVGGDNAIPRQFPYQVSLRLNHEHNCGGSIISNRYILTAAHCVTARQNLTYLPRVLSVRAGTNNRMAGGIIVPVNRIISHNYYNNSNDVALIELKEKLIFSETIQPIEMFDGKVPPNSEIIISGWGYTAHHGPSSPIYLQYTKLSSLSKLQCTKTIKTYTDSLICLNHQEGTGACFGDSGGPATYNGKLIGVANFITADCGSSSPDGYANVSYYNDWIRKNMT